MPAGQEGTIAKKAGEAKLQLTQALKLLGRDGDPRRQANIRGNLGLALSFLGRYRDAERQYVEALRIFRSLQVPSEVAACLANIGHHYKEWAIREKKATRATRQQRMQTALSYSRQAHALRTGIDNLRRLGLSKHTIGEIYLLQGRHRAAKKWLEEALAIFRSENLGRYAADVELTLARIPNRDPI